MDPVTDRLLAKMAGAGPFRVKAVTGGGNNRGFVVQAPSGRFFLKAYFHHSSDKRDRLKIEFGFCDFLWSNKLRSVPKPLALDKKNHLGLYEYIEGRPLTVKDLALERVLEAVRFFLSINKLRRSAAAQRLAPASEACFSVRDQLAVVSRRLARMTLIKPEGPAHARAIRFAREKMEPAWRRITVRVEQRARAAGLSLSRTLSMRERCLSPSDFGFHNAILTGDGTLRFVDFEYAGWDDVAKTVCDFALQPRLPFPEKFLPAFCDPVLAFFGDEQNHRRRIEMFYPVFAFKWCCIMLNDFMPAGRHTRAFALDLKNRQHRLTQQLKKAENYLERALGEFHGLR